MNRTDTALDFRRQWYEEQKRKAEQNLLKYKSVRASIDDLLFAEAMYGSMISYEQGQVAKWENKLNNPVPNWRTLEPGTDLDFEVACRLVECFGWEFSGNGSYFPSYSTEIKDMLATIDELWDEISLNLGMRSVRWIATVSTGKYSKNEKFSVTRIGHKSGGENLHIDYEDNFDSYYAPAMAIARAFLTYTDILKKLNDQ